MSLDYNFTKPYCFAEILEAFKTYSVADLLGSSSQGSMSDEFQTNFRNWLANDLSVRILGLDQLPYFYDTYGISHAIQIAIASTDRRVRFLSDDYDYYLHCCACFEKDYKVVDKELFDIEPGDYLFISQPAYKNGNVIKQFDTWMEICTEKDVEVFVDCAFFGSVPNINLKIHPCITDVCFSFSKMFALESSRIGYHFSSYKNEVLADLFDYGYMNRPAQTIANSLITKFTPSSIPRKYRTIQQEICKSWNLAPSDSIWLGIDSLGQRTSLYEGYRALRL